MGKEKNSKKKTEIQFKNIELLNTYIDSGKILPRRKTNLTVQEQKNLKKAVKQARILGLLPF